MSILAICQEKYFVELFSYPLGAKRFKPGPSPSASLSVCKFPGSINSICSAETVIVRALSFSAFSAPQAAQIEVIILVPHRFLFKKNLTRKSSMETLCAQKVNKNWLNTA